MYILRVDVIYCNSLVEVSNVLYLYYIFNVNY